MLDDLALEYAKKRLEFTSVGGNTTYCGVDINKFTKEEIIKILEIDIRHDDSIK